MHGRMTVGARDHQIADGVRPAFRHRFDVVQAQATCVAADDALLPITGEHRPPRGRGDGLPPLFGDVCFQRSQGRRGQLAQGQFQYVIGVILYRFDLALIQGREELGEGSPITQAALSRILAESYLWGFLQPPSPTTCNTNLAALVAANDCASSFLLPSAQPQIALTKIQSTLAL